MHHLMIANDIVEKAKNFGSLKSIKSITLEVGELAKATPHQIKEGIANINAWDIKIMPKPAVVECKCGHKGMPRITDRNHDFVFFECPLCGELPEVVEGDDIKIINVEVDEEA